MRPQLNADLELLVPATVAWLTHSNDNVKIMKKLHNRYSTFGVNWTKVELYSNKYLNKLYSA